jgi:spore maturation protein CgeB
MGKLRFRLFAHSWTSDWNHGNAHFLRGLASELVRLGHEVRCYEERESWSRTNLLGEGAAGERAIDRFHQLFPELDVRFYDPDATFHNYAAQELSSADIVVLHEWTRLCVVQAVQGLRKSLGFRLLFHDTHHRAYTNPKEIGEINPDRFDGVLVFGEALVRIYRDLFGVERAWVFHEAADTTHFLPLSAEKRNTDVIWVGNWGDEERTRELQEFLIRPAAALREYDFAVHGVRYSISARNQLKRSGIDYRGYLPNLEAPRAYSSSAISLHVPRRFYANGLSGIPTIRVFETLACGVPLVCSPWADAEGLFRAGVDFITVPDGPAMKAALRGLLLDDKARQQIAANGLETIRAHHTCAQRAQQLLEICEELN